MELWRKNCVLVPTVNETSTSQCLSDRHSLLLTSRDTTDASISDEGLPGVAKPKDGDEDVGDFADKLVSGLTFHSSVRCTSLSRKLDCFLDGQGGEMDVVLGGILDIPTIVSGDICGGERIIVNITLDVMVCVALVREHLEERCASGSWATQDD